MFKIKSKKRFNYVLCDALHIWNHTFMNFLINLCFQVNWTRTLIKYFNATIFWP